MNNEGPPLESLLRRLAETPGEFLASPRVADRGEVQVDAVVADLARSLGARVEVGALASLRATSPCPGGKCTNRRMV